MSAAAKIDEQRRDTISRQSRIIYILSAMIIVLVIGLVRSFEVRPIWVAPDLSSGQKISKSGPYRNYPYVFAYRLFDTLWTWNDSADKEYPLLIEAVKPYIDDRLISRFKREAEDLSERRVAKKRTRLISEIIPRDISKMVKIISPERFIVFLDIEVKDKLKGTLVSWERKRLALVVEVNTSDMDNNPYGMKIVNYYREPQSLD